MRKTKISLIVATVAILLGAIIFAGAMSTINWNFEELSTVKMQTKEHEINDTFSEISVISNTADILFAISDDGKCKVVCYEETKLSHDVCVENNALTITVKNERRWIDYIGFNFSTPSVTVYLPASEYGTLKVKSNTSDVTLTENLKLDTIDIKVNTGNVKCGASATGDVKIEASTGDIDLSNASAGSVDLTVSTGKITANGINCDGDITVTVSTGKSFIRDVECKNLTTTGNTGNITLEDVIASGKLSINRTTGDVKIESSDAGEIMIKTDTGDVKGTLLSEKIFITHTSTGDVEVPKSTSGGICEITTSTGDVEIEIKGA